eukprot:2139446-Heterocapsa_arctica.AAC.1
MPPPPEGPPVVGGAAGSSKDVPVKAMPPGFPPAPPGIPPSPQNPPNAGERCPTTPPVGRIPTTPTDAQVWSGGAGVNPLLPRRLDPATSDHFRDRAAGLASMAAM